MNLGEKITFIGYTDFRNKRIKFGIKNKDRLRHVYIIGKTGMGKSTLLENMAAQDILNGEGFCFIDPHGSAIDTLLDYIPDERVNDVVYFAPFDTDYPISFNVLEKVDEDKKHLVVSGLMATFEKIWPDTFSERMKYILSNTLLALLEFPGATLLGVNRMLSDKFYRKAVIEHITDSSVRAFWIDEFNKWDPRYAREASAAIQNKIGQFTSNPLIRNIIGQEKSSFHFRKIMDEKKILLVNLSKGQIGDSNANLLGGMFITKLALAAMSRADVGSSLLARIPPFFLFVDEFQNFANRPFADILSEARKYKLGLTIAHQYIDQMETEVASAVFGNVGTIITFRIGAADAEILEKQFASVFSAEDFISLGRFQIYLSLMIDGIGSRPFSASTLPPLKKPDFSLRKEVIANSRYWYSEKRDRVERAIRNWYSISYEEMLKKMKRISNGKNNKDLSMEMTESETKPEVQDLERTEKVRGGKIFQEMGKVVSPKLQELLERVTHKTTLNDKNRGKKNGKKKKKRGKRKKSMDDSQMKQKAKNKREKDQIQREADESAKSELAKTIERIRERYISSEKQESKDKTQSGEIEDTFLTKIFNQDSSL